MGDLIPLDGGRTGDWHDRLILTERGKPVPCEANIALILEHDPAWSGVLARSSFLGSVVFLRSPPIGPPRAREARWDAQADRWLQDYCAVMGMQPPTLAKVQAALEATTLPDYDPVRAYLETLSWDRTPRISDWLATYCGAEDQPTAPMVGRWWLISAVARAMRPGCKVDTVIVFESPEQGFRKSTLVTSLLPNAAWFCDGLSDPGSKDAAIELDGKWIIELGELASIRKGDVERVKSFISRQVDNYRAPYARHSTPHPRHCVFAGTTNQVEYLNDPTGNRRFWPILVRRVDIEGLLRDRDQLWAEAVSCYSAGMPWWPTEQSEFEALAGVAESRRVTDAWEERIALYCATNARVTVSEVLDALGVELQDQDKARQMRVVSALQAIGYTAKERVRFGPKRDGLDRPKRVEWRRPATPPRSEL